MILLKALRVPVILFLLFFEVGNAGGILIDRIAGTVNDEIILYSDVEIERILMISEGNDREIVWNLIDRWLLLQEAEKFKITEDDQDLRRIQQRLENIKAKLGIDEFQAVSRIFNITEADVQEKLKEKVITDKFTDFRINFFIVISNDAIKAYYNEHIDDYAGMTQDEAFSQIRSRLFNDESRKRYDDYMNQLRGKARININL